MQIEGISSDVFNFKGANEKWTSLKWNCLFVYSTESAFCTEWIRGIFWWLRVWQVLMCADSNPSAVDAGEANSLERVKQGFPAGFLSCDTNFPHLPCYKYFWLDFLPDCPVAPFCLFTQHHKSSQSCPMEARANKRGLFLASKWVLQMDHS